MKYAVKIQTLTPLHISSGTELLANFDYLAGNQQTYILNQHAIFDRELEINGNDARLDQPAGIIGKEHWRADHVRVGEFVRAA